MEQEEHFRYIETTLQKLLLHTGIAITIEAFNRERKLFCGPLNKDVRLACGRVRSENSDAYKRIRNSGKRGFK